MTYSIAITEVNDVNGYLMTGLMRFNAHVFQPTGNYYWLILPADGQWRWLTAAMGGMTGMTYLVTTGWSNEDGVPHNAGS